MEKCDTGSFIFKQDASNWRCVRCSPNCLTCEELAIKCTSCNTGLILTKDFICLEQRYYQLTLALICLSPCRSCFGSSSNCTTCLSSYYLHSNTCLQKCPDGYYVELSSQSCEKCHQSCLTCTERLTKCTSCLPGKVLFREICFDTPLENLWLDITTYTWRMCLSSCRRCINAITCTHCYSNQVLTRNGSCMDRCDIG